MMKKSKLHTLLREPLLHFLVLGAALFIVFDQNNNWQAETESRIVISQADLDALTSAWLKNVGRPPSAEEREQQLNSFIRQQVLAREAVAMGLDKDDAVVSNRMAKKMEYLFEDLSFISEPTDEELDEYRVAHPASFTLPAEMSFQQVFFDATLRGETVSEDAKQVLKELQQVDNAVDTLHLGDRSLLPYEFKRGRETQIAGMFGEKFTQQIFLLPVNSWQGPIVSPYGEHLIYIHSRSDAQLPALDKIRDRVAQEWRSTKQKAANEVFYQSLYQRYEIVVDAEAAGE